MEIIPTENTDPEIVEAIRNFGERVLGKGGVIAKDTPNFIGNRIGTFAGMQSARYAFENGYGIEEVDAITGPLIGHPKTATFRLNDQVGLDIAVGVAENLYEAVPEDESREELKPPEKLEEMQEKDLLGNKTGAGFYKRDKREGKTVFDVLDLETFEHHPVGEPRDPHRQRGATTGRPRLEAAVPHRQGRRGQARPLHQGHATTVHGVRFTSVPEISDTLEDVGPRHGVGLRPPDRTLPHLGPARRSRDRREDAVHGHRGRRLGEGDARRRKRELLQDRRRHRAPVQPGRQRVRASPRRPDVRVPRSAA